MGLIANLVERVAGGPQALSVPVRSGGAGVVGSLAGGTYTTFASAYRSNEIVFAAVKLLADSAAEPKVIGWRMRRERARRTLASQGITVQSVIDEYARLEMEMAVSEWKALGIRNRAGAMRLQALLVQNRFIETLPRHPLVQLLNKPNPFRSRGQLWRTIVMDRLLAGNAYLYKGRTDIGTVAELWRLRPDRVRVIVDSTGQRVGYEYRIDSRTVQEFPVEDVIHFRDPDPLDEHYGMPPLMAIASRIDIDNYFRGFLRTFFERGGAGPGSILAIKDGKLPKEEKDGIQERFRTQFGGYSGWHEMLIVDNSDTTYTRLGLDRGLRDALPKELNDVTESRIAMGFRIPGSILGLLIGYESSSYANKRQDWQVLWDLTMSPMMSDLDDQLNLDLVPEFGGIDEVAFDLSEIRALQEDEDAMQDRARANLQVGGWTREEFRQATGVEPEPAEGLFYIPGSVSPTRAGEEMPPDWARPDPGEQSPAQGLSAAIRAALASSGPPKLLTTSKPTGRRRLEDDPSARELWERGSALQQRDRLTNEQVAIRMGVSERTWRRYRERFGE